MENFLSGSEALQDPAIIKQATDNVYFVGTIILYIVLALIIVVCFCMKKNYRENVRYIFKNISLLYKNFLHWNVSKIIIILYSIISGFVLSIPFGALSIYLIYNILSKLNPTSIQLFLINGSMNEELLSALIGNIWTVLGILFLLLIIITIFIFTFTYGYFLLQNVYKSYLEGEKLGFTKNLYFSKIHLYKYLGVLSWVALYMLIPTGIGFIILIGLMALSYFGIISENMSNLGNIIFGSITLILFIGLMISFIYMGVRLAFSYILFLYTKNTKEKCKKYIDESFKITKSKVIKIVLLILPLIFIISLSGTIKEKLPDNQILYTIYSIITFLVLEGISYMGYISIYLLLKKEKN